MAVLCVWPARTRPQARPSQSSISSPPCSLPQAPCSFGLPVPTSLRVPFASCVCVGSLLRRRKNPAEKGREEGWEREVSGERRRRRRGERERWWWRRRG
eukprot:2431296-Rhodomonas_salina.1